MGSQTGWWNNLQGTVNNIANSATMDLSQTVTGLKNGLYEVRINCYTEFSGGTASSEATYNYMGFIYANDYRNYVKTQLSNLQSDEMRNCILMTLLRDLISMAN
jgi:hypothetical protein